MTNYEKLVSTLREVFMLDKAELDFGIYRIMNQKRVEIEQFLEKDLVPQVKELLGKTVNEGLEEKKQELKKLEATLLEVGVDPQTNPKYLTLNEAIVSYGNPEATENEVFSHLTTFFRRYYDNGDFISQRRYKKDVYAIPYEGEEVKLHWANADQYYIKTSEYLKNYGFKLDNGKRVQFVLTEASTEHNNNKTQGDKERRFALDKEVPFREDDENTLSILFTYEPVDKKKKQKDLNEDAVSALLVAANQMELDMRQAETLPAEWRNELAKQYKSKTKKDGSKDVPVSWLEYHITQYTARNTFDYFIHKDLGGFLTRELDFYIKNEVLFLDDINTNNTQDYTKTLSKLRAIKAVGGKIITFLAQLEDFQKKLWLKKKFVVATNYCITLDRIDPIHYPTIVANEAQRVEWVRLFAIDEITESAPTIENPKGSPAYSMPLSVEFLKANPYLLVDTALYDQEFKDAMLADVENLDDNTDGLMINSENFQALNLLSNCYESKIDSIYIDPPYNTAASEISYKNNYKSSSWLSFVYDRIATSKRLIKESGNICVTIDDFELYNLKFILDLIFKTENYIATTPIRNNPSGRSTITGFSVTHEYGLFYGKSEVKKIGRLPHTEEQRNRYNLKDQNGSFEWENLRRNGPDSNKEDRPKQFYPLLIDNDLNIIVPNMKYSEESKEWIMEGLNEGNFTVVYPIHSDGTKKVWRYSVENIINEPQRFKAIYQNNHIELYRKKYLNDDGYLPRTWWDKASYSARDNGARDIGNIFKEYQVFEFPKAKEAVSDSIRVLNCSYSGIVLDYFAGSGTTGHAVINLNREDEGSRKYVLVEMGTYFDSVTKPRIQKVIYSGPDGKDNLGWKDGKPTTRKGISHMFKYMTLESYEDTLNNLELVRSDDQTLALQSDPRFKEGYMLQYMLDVEAKGSLFNLKWFENPFEVYLNITQNNETLPTKIDLVETFNYLIGLTVSTQYTTTSKGCKYKVVTGTSPEGEKVLVVWRDVTAFATLQESNNALNEYLARSAYNPLDSEYDVIYVNCDNNVENLKTGEESWKVRLIEQEFSNQMFS